MLSKLGLVFGVVSIIGFFTGVGVGFVIFWYQFRVRLLNLFISNYDLLEGINEITSCEDEEYEEEENCEDD